MKRILFFSVGFTIALYLVRVVYTGSLLFLFIPWNLFLAWLPFYFSTKMKSEQTIPVKLLWFCSWLLFLPNAPYLITDLVHLEPRPYVPYYFDLVLLFSAAWNGLLLGLLSFQQIERQLNMYFDKWKVNSIIFVLFLLCGFGIYLGRFDRYNSWHIITQPFDLATDIIRYTLQPLQHLHTWAVTVLFGAALWLMYQTMRQLQSVSQR
ncbi:DUF1361 domain-containing protein [Lacibacter sp. MH-610]|uniref:DUF1361 domain-containing protein n=1 Tax=Lacibacter sp. MH-610 TaxID=3020883 RepID=UPI0038925825